MARPARGAAAPAEPAPSAPAPAPAPALSVPTPVPSPEAAASEPSVPEQFDAAFSEAVAAEATSPPPVVPTPALAAATPKKPAEPKKDSTPAVEPPTSVPAEPPQPESPTGEPLPPQPPERSPQPQPQNPPPQPPQPQPPPPPPPPPQPQPQAQAPQEPPLFNADEVAQLQTFYTDWPDVARATETMIRGIMGQTARRMYQDMAASLAPYLQTIDTLADRQQLSELQGNVPDYNTVAGQLTSWAASQPTYLRSAYEHVIKSGTAAEVVDLINRYKQDMQSTTPAQGNPPAALAASAPASTPTPAPVSPALAAAAARLAPVSTKRTNVVAPPADFDTAFAEFARAS